MPVVETHGGLRSSGGELAALQRLQALLASLVSNPVGLQHRAAQPVLERGQPAPRHALLVTLAFVPAAGEQVAVDDVQE
jgi:hypothetical protein